MNGTTTLKQRKSTTIDRREEENLSLKADDELQSCNLRNNRCQRETDSEQTFISTGQYRIRKLKDDSEKDAAIFKVRLQECQSQLDSLKCEKLKLLERIEALTQQNDRQSSFRGQVAYIIDLLFRRVGFLCVQAIIIFVAICLLWIMASDNRLHRERNAEQSSRIEKLETDSNAQRDHFDIQLREQKVKLDAMNSENLLLRDQTVFANKQNGALTEQNNRQSSRIEKLETESKEQREHFVKELQTTQELKGELKVVNVQNEFLRDNNAIANKQIEILQSQIEKMSNETKEKHQKAMVLRMNEDQEGRNFLVKCIREKDSESKGVAKVSILWGAYEATYATQSGLNECLIMHDAAYGRQASYLQIQ